MSDTIEKLIEIIIKGGCDSADCDHCEISGIDIFKCLRKDAGLKADQIIESGLTVQQWIPVSEPPKQDGRYQVYKSSHIAGYDQDILSFAKDGREIDSYDFKDNWENVWYYYDSEWGYVTIDNVTHWMPLPSAPKGE